MSQLINITSPAFMWQSASDGHSAELSPLVGLPGAKQRYQPVKEFYHLRSHRSHMKDRTQHTKPTGDRRAWDQPWFEISPAGQRAPAGSCPARPPLEPAG